VADDVETGRSAFEMVNREVWIVTAEAAGRRGGLVATWVSQASLDPADPMAVVALGVNHFTTELVDRSRAFALHLITADQIDLAWRFALSSGRETDKFAGLDFSPGGSGAPRLQNCLAWLECQVIHQHSAADRTLFWGQVVAGDAKSSGVPLCERELFAAANEEQRAILKRNLQDDIAVQRPWVEAWKDKNAQ